MEDKTTSSDGRFSLPAQKLSFRVDGDGVTELCRHDTAKWNCLLCLLGGS